MSLAQSPVLDMRGKSCWPWYHVTRSQDLRTVQRGREERMDRLEAFVADRF